MKRLNIVMVIALLSVWFSSSALAEQPKNPGPEVINIKMGNVDLAFQHWKHQTNMHNECFNCHKTKIGQIDNWGKEAAHKICIPCHDLENKGPVLCQECHTKETVQEK